MRHHLKEKKKALMYQCPWRYIQLGRVKTVLQTRMEEPVFSPNWKHVLLCTAFNDFKKRGMQTALAMGLVNPDSEAIALCCHDDDAGKLLSTDSLNAGFGCVSPEPCTFQGLCTSQTSWYRQYSRDVYWLKWRPNWALFVHCLPPLTQQVNQGNEVTWYPALYPINIL